MFCHYLLASFAKCLQPLDTSVVENHFAFHTFTLKLALQMTLPDLYFPGQNWKGTDFYPDGSPSRGLLDNCMKATNWEALCLYASTLNNSIECRILPNITNGQFHLVRLLEFENQSRWIARIQLRKSTERLAKKLQREVDAMAIVRERTNIPVPQVFGYEINDSNSVGAAFILMEFLPGNVAMDADGGYKTHNGEIPPQHKSNFYNKMAQVQVSTLILSSNNAMHLSDKHYRR